MDQVDQSQEPGVAYVPPAGQAELVAALRAGDEQAFTELIEELGPSMLRVARMYVSTRAVAEDVVQETWLGVLSGIGRFEGRSSLKTWIFRILTNRAKTRGEREGRSVPFSSFASDAEADEGATVDADRFQRGGQFEGAWTSAPSRWSDLPENRLVGKETDRGGAGRDRRAAREPARGDHDARRRRLELRGGS